MNHINIATKILEKSRRLLIGAGAGMGKDSGMPDFRGPEGFWNNYPPYRNKFNFVDCANPAFLYDHPHLFWGFYGSRLIMYRETKPHNGFNILKQFSQKMSSHFIITSNVDGHFQRVFDEQNVYQVHGSINHLQCSTCGTVMDNNFQPKVNYEEMSCQNLPKCQKCGDNLRPNILMFNDWEWNSDRSDIQSEKFSRFMRQKEGPLVIIELGSGTAVPTIRNMCERAYYKQKNSYLIRINPDEDSSEKWMDKDRYLHIRMGALEALKRIKQNLQG